ncbi:MAG: hypothetical protein ACOYYI_09510 [Chloroflexota bacterium]
MTTTTTQTGLVGFLCEVTDQPVSFDQCLACARKGAPDCPMVPAAIHAAIHSIRDPQYAQKMAEEAGAKIGFSVTELLNCPRQTRLKMEVPFYEKPSAFYRMNRGTGYHHLLSRYDGGICEKTLTWKFIFRGRSILLVGTPDLVELTPDGWFITDYKVTSKPPFGKKVTLCARCEGETYEGDDGLTCRECGAILRSKSEILREYRPPQARSSHIMQVNLYALLIEKNAEKLAAMVGKSKPEKFAGAEVVYFGEKSPVRCPVKLDRDAAMTFLKRSLAALIADDLPPVLSDVDELWRCDYCPVRTICEQIHGGPVGKTQ